MAPGNPHKGRGMSILLYLHPELPEQGLALLLVDRLNDVQGRGARVRLSSTASSMLSDLGLISEPL